MLLHIYSTSTLLYIYSRTSLLRRLVMCSFTSTLTSTLLYIYSRTSLLRWLVMCSFTSTLTSTLLYIYSRTSLLRRLVMCSFTSTLTSTSSSSGSLVSTASVAAFILPSLSNSSRLCFLIGGKSEAHGAKKGAQGEKSCSLRERRQRMITGPDYHCVLPLL